MAFAEKNKKWLGYALYVVLVTLALLYYLFPAQAVEEFVDNSVRRINPAFGFKAENMRPRLPAGLRLSDSRIFLTDSPGPAVFQADNLSVKARLLRLVMGRYSFALAGTAYKGDVTGWYDSQDPDGNTFASALTFKDIDLADYAFLAGKFPGRLTGKIAGDITFNRDSAGAPGDNGKASLRLNNGQLQLQVPLFGISAVDLQSIDMELELGKGKIAVSRADLAGPEVKAAMSGVIQLQPDIKQSQLNLMGTLEPLAEFYKNHPDIREILKAMKKRVKRGQYFFAITGTLAEPIFKLL